MTVLVERDGPDAADLARKFTPQRRDRDGHDAFLPFSGDQERHKACCQTAGGPMLGIGYFPMTEDYVPVRPARCSRHSTGNVSIKTVSVTPAGSRPSMIA